MDKQISSTITSLLHRVPGYTGYRSLEDRRDDDRRLRDAVADQIDAIVTSLGGVSASLAAERKLTHISVIERLVGAARLLGDRVRNASYGYGGIFTERSVDSVAIEQLRQFDAAFKSDVDNLQSLAQRLASSPEGPLDTDISAYQDELNRLSRLFDARTEVVDTARPNRDSGVLAMLEPTIEPRPSPISTLKVKDAFSVLGDDFIVDAAMTFTGDSGSLNLVRAGKDDQGKDLWFAGGSDGSTPTARLTESEAGAGETSNGTTATLTVATTESKNPEVPAQYGYTGGTDSSVSLWYTVGNETRHFTGTAVDISDIQVYGQA